MGVNVQVISEETLICHCPTRCALFSNYFFRASPNRGNTNRLQYCGVAASVHIKPYYISASSVNAAINL